MAGCERAHTDTHTHIICSLNWQHLLLLLYTTQIMCQVQQLTAPCSSHWRLLFVMWESLDPTVRFRVNTTDVVSNTSPSLWRIFKRSCNCQHIRTESNHVCMCESHADTFTLIFTSSMHLTHPPVKTSLFNWCWAKIRGNCKTEDYDKKR